MSKRNLKTTLKKQIERVRLIANARLFNRASDSNAVAKLVHGRKRRVAYANKDRCLKQLIERGGVIPEVDHVRCPGLLSVGLDSLRRLHTHEAWFDPAHHRRIELRLNTHLPKEETIMPYVIHETRNAAFPSAATVERALSTHSLSILAIEEAVKSCVCPHPYQVKGYQIPLAKHLANHIERSLTEIDSVIAVPDRTYRLEGRERADLVLGSLRANGRIFIEIEFRPNFEKDIYKFGIGWKANRLSVGVLIVTMDRETISPKYRTMPTFETVARSIPSFPHDYPILLIGLRGRHAAAAAA